MKEEMIGKLKIEYVSLRGIRPNEYNPKSMSKKEAKDLERSITEFGMVDPIIVNKAKGREGVIIGGHQRYTICVKLGYEEIPVIWVNISDIKREQELCLSLTHSTGSWEMDLLANIDDDILAKVGFTDKEIDDIIGHEEDGNVEEPEVVFTEELRESHNYVILYFDNDIDWLNAETLFGLKTVHSLDSKETFKRCGIGRVLNGSEALNDLKRHYTGG